VCKMHHNKGKLHDAAFEILLIWYMRIWYKINTFCGRGRQSAC
jgi:hypothetical protein